jgi:hypothetical protein
MSDRSGKEGKGAAASPAAGERRGTPVVAEVMPKTALAVLKDARIAIASQEELEARGLQVRQKFEALAELAYDPSFSEETKAKVKDLLALASPVKPGMEEMMVTPWSVVRVNMAQPTSELSAKPESARPGDMYTTAGALLDKSFAFIPLHFHVENIMFIKGQRAPECGAPDAKLGDQYGLCSDCEHLPFGLQNGGRGEQVKTKCQNQIVVAALAADLSQVYLLTFGKTSRSAGTDLVKLAKMQPYPWKQSYRLSTERGKGEQGVYYVFKVEATSKDNPPEVVRLAQALSELFSANRKQFIAEWYVRVAAAAETAAATEAAFSASTASGRFDDREGEVSAEASRPARKSVRTAAHPM